MRNLFLILLFGLIISCEEETRVSLIEGNLFQDCTEPLVNFELALKSNIGGDFQDPFILGSGTSTIDGSFSFTYELDEEDEGTADLLLIKQDGFETLIERLTLNEDYNLNLYREKQSVISVNLGGSRQYASDDSLLFGIDFTNKEFTVLNPSNGNLLDLDVMLSNTTSGINEAILYYGVGAIEFDRARNASNNADSTFQNLPFSISGCGDTTAVLVIID